MTIRNDPLVLQLLLLMPQFLFLVIIYHSVVNVDEYQVNLGKIQAISVSFESYNMFIIGDSNADLNKTSLFPRI